MGTLQGQLLRSLGEVIFYLQSEREAFLSTKCGDQVVEEPSCTAPDWVEELNLVEILHDLLLGRFRSALAVTESILKKVDRRLPSDYIPRELKTEESI